MATITTYEIDKDLTSDLSELLDDCQELHQVKEHVQLAICFKVRVNDDEGHEPLAPNGELIALKKIPPEMQVLMENEPKYVLVVDQYFWNEAEAMQRKAQLHRMLTRIKVDPKNSGEGFKLSLKPWDVQDNLLTFNRFGAYTPTLLKAGESLEAKKNNHILDLVTTKTKAPATKAIAAPAAKAPAKPAAKAPAKPAAKAPVKPASKPASAMPEDEDPETPEDPPRVHAAEWPVKTKTSPLKKDDKIPARPARKPAPEPEPEADEDPPEPEDADNS